MDPRVKYQNYEKLIGITKQLLPALERIVPAAKIVAEGRHLTSEQQEEMHRNFEIMHEAKKGLDELYAGVVRVDSPEAVFVSSTIRGGHNNCAIAFHTFAYMPDDSEMAQDVDLQKLHPYHRLYSDMTSLARDVPALRITVAGDNAERANAYYKTAPYPAAVIWASKAVYALVFSGLLLAADGKEVSLDFTAGADGKDGYLNVDNSDGCLADRLKGMIVRPHTRPSFLEPVFVSGMNVQGTSIAVPFRVARIV